MQIDVSTVIDRTPDIVFRFVAVGHVRNHPRWDPYMELRLETPGPIGVGSRIARRHTRLSWTIIGTMEITEFEPGRSFGSVVRDQTPHGLLEARGRMTMDPEGEGGTRLTIHLEIPSMAKSMDPSMIEGSLARSKELIEAET